MNKIIALCAARNLILLTAGFFAAMNAAETPPATADVAALNAKIVALQKDRQSMLLTNAKNEEEIKALREQITTLSKELELSRQTVNGPKK
jgi:peptidoglycan hydrolase CwlO-like protein